MQALMPAVGVLGSVGMMSTMRTGTSAVIGVGVLALTLVGTFGMAFSQRGRSGKESREQRNRYLDYLRCRSSTVRQACSRKPPVRRGSCPRGRAGHPVGARRRPDQHQPA
jgi:hypothetical protein